jgi:hypothetical protein
MTTRDPIRVLLPLNWIPPDAWRTRFEHLAEDFAREGPLARAFQEIRRTADDSGDLAAQEATEMLVRENADLFPGDAGLEVAWAIVCGSKPSQYLPPAGAGDATVSFEGEGLERSVFDEPIPPFTSRYPRRGGKNRFKSRALRTAPEMRRVLHLLSGDRAQPPRTFREAAWRTSLTSTAFNQLLYRLRARLGVRVRRSEEQSLVAEIVRPWLKRGFSRKAVVMPLEEAAYRTGHALDELEAFPHFERFTRTLPGGEPCEMVKVPVELILFDSPSPPDE